MKLVCLVVTLLAAAAPFAPAAEMPLKRALLPGTLPDHPRLLFRKESLPAIRERVEKTEWGKEAFRLVQKHADSWLEREVAPPPDAFLPKFAAMMLCLGR